MHRWLLSGAVALLLTGGTVWAQGTPPAPTTDPAPVEIKIPRDPGDVIAVIKEYTTSEGLKCVVVAGYGGLALSCAPPTTAPADPAPTPAPAPKK